MDMATLSGLATKAVISGSALVGRKLLTTHQRNKIATEAASVVVAGNTERFVEHLEGRQLRSFKEFVQSAQFESLVRQAMIASLAAKKDEAHSSIREQLRHGLRLRAFTEADLLQATDILHELVDAAVHAVRQSATPGTLDTALAVAMAGNVAIAGVRNSELLRQIGSLDEIDRFVRAARAAAKSGHAKLRLAAHDMNRHVDYSQLYVAPTFLLNSSFTREGVPPSGAERCSLTDALYNKMRFVVLGDPGAGKSTLAGKLAHDLATDKIAGLEGQVPILLVVRAHTQSLRTDHQTLLHYLEAACRRPGNVTPPQGSLEHLLLNGRATVIIDGVDELGEGAFRKSFVQLVEGFAHRYPLARVVVTSRIVGYPEASLDAELFPTVNIAPFDETQVASYASRWFRLNPSLNAEQRKQLTQSFMRESAAAHDLRINPLLLSLLCGLYSTVHYIPRNKPEIYEKCAELLFETWDRSRGIEVTHRYAAHIRPAVQRLAWRLFTDERGRQALPRSEIVGFLAEYMRAKRFEDPDEASQAATDFLDFCAGRAWVLTEVGSDALQPRYGFVHRTFLEYFAASQLVKQDPNPAGIWERLEPRLRNGTWDVVGQLSVQILDRNIEDGADRILQLALDHLDRAVSNVDNHLSFVAQCMDNIAPDNATVRGVAYGILKKVCEVPASARRTTSMTVARSVNDDSLSRLLSVNSPDNADRLVRGIAEAVIHYAEEMPSSRSAGLVYQFFLGKLFKATNPLPLQARVAEEIEKYPVPEAAALWRRRLVGPSVEDLAAGGLSLLYETSHVCLTMRGPTLRFLLPRAPSDFAGAEGDPDVAANATLESYYSQVVAGLHWLERAELSPHPWGYALTLIDLTAFKSLSQRARGSLLLLLLPVLRIADAQRDHGLFNQFISAVQGRYAEAAIESVNSWALPTEAHDFMVDWVRRPR
ncbi:NACHT domain-containing protein [Asanoa sp. WMMD1127]|uniref:NACHT domain-containing protein n=1 Tax=Asanoa sp. WMMD1127 TaxID=3016107 RepID=UPI002416CAE8|nr:NACHT domain-containing protein [Asanoa sp. WMMD1127]MDG4824921.1 NACHT domain-containing protein [Asanoa sp. WMMD1127]